MLKVKNSVFIACFIGFLAQLAMKCAGLFSSSSSSDFVMIYTSNFSQNPPTPQNFVYIKKLTTIATTIGVSFSRLLV